MQDGLAQSKRVAWDMLTDYSTINGRGRSGRPC